MTNICYPTSAYDMVTPADREVLEEYVAYAVAEQQRKHQRVDLALNLPIPAEFMRKGRNCFEKPLVQAALRERLLEESALRDISPDRIVKEYGKIAFSDITDFLEQGGWGAVQLKDLSTVPAEKMGAVKSIETKPTQNGVQVKVVMHDKFPALRALCELSGLQTPENPAPLAEYVKQEIRQTTQELVEHVPEAEYTELLEEVNRADK